MTTYMENYLKYKMDKGQKNRIEGWSFAIEI